MPGNQSSGRQKHLTEQHQCKPTSCGKPHAEEKSIYSWSQGIPQDALLEDQGRMTNIQELVDKLRSEYQTESVISDLWEKRKINKFSEELKRTIQRLGNIVLYKLGEISKTTQYQACSKVLSIQLLMWSMPHALAGTLAQDQKSIRDPFYSVPRRENQLLTSSETWAEPIAVWSLESKRCKTQCGKEQSQNHLVELAKTMRSIGTPNNSRLERGIMDSIASADISYVATWSERSRYENHLTLGINDGPPPRRTKLRSDFPRAVRTRAAIKHEERRMYLYMPKHLQRQNAMGSWVAKLELESQKQLVAKKTSEWSFILFDCVFGATHEFPLCLPVSRAVSRHLYESLIHNFLESILDQFLVTLPRNGLSLWIW